MPVGANSKREHEYQVLAQRFKREHRYVGREEEVAARIVNKQRSQYGETRSEREKLMFRLKVKPDAAWLAAHRDLAKGGMPGVAYVRLDANAAWPANLQIDGK